MENVRQSREAAQQHLSRIRAEKGLGDLQGPKAIVKDLEAALKVYVEHKPPNPLSQPVRVSRLYRLSDQLYQNSNHFLLELIQNADDNHYEAEMPTLHLSYARNHLRIDCNEVGFSPKDVDAICRIGQSTKTGAGVSTQYVGEKGDRLQIRVQSC
jgi:hypothetical protein